MSPPNDIALERYLAGDMTDDEAQVFLEQAKDDPALLAQLGSALIQQSLITDVARADAEDRRARRADRGSSPKIVAHRSWALPIAVAATVFLALTVGVIALRPAEVAQHRVRIASITNEVFVREGGAEVPVVAGLEVTGRRLRTSAGATVAVEFVDEATRVELAGDTEAVFRPSKRIELVSGGLRADVVTQRVGESLSVETPHAVLTVVGTRFAVSADGDVTRLEVTEGAVNAAMSDSKAPPVDVRAGQYVSVRPDRPLAVGAIDEARAIGTVAGKTYHVDQGRPGADDANPGTAERPFATISKACAVVAPGDVVRIGPGVYREAVELATSGRRDAPIAFVADEPGRSIVSGADLLSDWVRVERDRPVYRTDWPHDFVIAQRDGEPVRDHGAPAPSGCAEQIICDGKPLAQVMAMSKLAQGRFYVDWDEDRLYVWLPGGADPSVATVEGCVRGTLMSPRERYNLFADARHIHVRGLTFRHAGNFAQRGGVIAGTGWRYEDCVVEWNNATGVRIEGDDVTLLRVTSQDNGFSGIGGRGANLLVKDCVSRRNNHKGFDPSWDGGGGKWTGTRNLRIVNLVSQGNTGSGLWLDHGNVDYLIEGCQVYANVGWTEDWHGSGIYLQLNPGPGAVRDCVVYSNTGSGIGIAECRDVTIERNVLVDNGDHIGLRAMDRTPSLAGLTIRGNAFGSPRSACVTTSLGEWTPRHVRERSIVFDGNTYGSAGGAPLFSWGAQKLETLDAVRTTLGLEASGRAAEVYFVRDLVPTTKRR